MRGQRSWTNWRTSHRVPSTRTRNETLRELYLARALFRCGDRDGLAARILGAYARDIRGHFARHAAAVLGGRAEG